MSFESCTGKEGDSGICVWICEDHAELRRTVAEIISGAVDLACPVAVGSVEELLCEMDERSGELPDIILLDLGLPGMGGLEGIKAIQSHSPYSKIVVFTISNDEEITFQALKNGVDGYLLKNESMLNIPEYLREVVEGGAPVSPSVVRMVLDRFSRKERFVIDRSKNSFGLSDLEKSIMLLCSHGLIKKDISEALEMGYHQVDYYMRVIFKKMAVSTIHGAVGKAFREGIIVSVETGGES